MNPRRILLADDHPIVLEGLHRLLETRYEVLATVDTGTELVERALALKPDLIVSDIAMPGCDGIRALQELRRLESDVKVIFLTMMGNMEVAVRALKAGAAGYVLKNAAGEELLTAIDEAIAGRVYVSPRIAGGVLGLCLAGPGGKSPRSGTASLTPRQTDVLRLVATGLTMKEVAARLNISTRTAESHKYQMMEQLGIKTTAELVQYAVRQGLLDSALDEAFPV
jgi:DNA-binding NarL/FixJ family response regulator